LAWTRVAAALAAAALLGWWLPAPWLDWQPALALSEPWRWWSAAFVHWSPLHLGANLAGALLVGALGHAARLPPALAWAWLAAWPLTHLALAVQPALAHYGGLSGLLHAGVAIVAVTLCWRGARRQRWIGVLLAAGLTVKLLLEAPWLGPLQRRAGWDIAIAPLAHLSGAIAGAACAALALHLTRHYQPKSLAP
jgi:rhomboid family GlyGly-CTERM serine protease